MYPSPPPHTTLHWTKQRLDGSKRHGALTVESKAALRGQFEHPSGVAPPLARTSQTGAIYQRHRSGKSTIQRLFFLQHLRLRDQPVRALDPFNHALRSFRKVTLLRPEQTLVNRFLRSKRSTDTRLKRGPQRLLALALIILDVPCALGGRGLGGEGEGRVAIRALSLVVLSRSSYPSPQERKTQIWHISMFSSRPPYARSR